jgi:CheY-like chemotaxis protein
MRANSTTVHLGKVRGPKMPKNKILFVGEDEVTRRTLTGVLEQSGFVVTSATNVLEALNRITSEPYDALLTELHWPVEADGLRVVCAMRHANPSAVILLLSAFPQVVPAVQTILLQAEEVRVKPTAVTSLVRVVKQRIAAGPAYNHESVSVGAILDRGEEAAIAEWYERVKINRLLMSVPLPCELRCAHLPLVFRDLVLRLQSSQPPCTSESLSPAAARHGLNRRRLGYSAVMLVEESRLLQVCIFHCLQNNQADIDFSVLLIGAMTIADEVESQLSQAMTAFFSDSLPVYHRLWHSLP